MGFDQTKYITEFMKDNYDEIKVRVPKGKRAIIKQLAIDHNITDDRGKVSVNRMMIEAIEEKYHVDLSKP